MYAIKPFATMSEAVKGGVPCAARAVDDRARHIVKGLRATRAQVEQATLARVVKKPKVDCNHIVYKYKVAHLFARSVAAVVRKQLDAALRLKLVELVEGHAGHAAFVLFARAVNIEIAKAHHLRSGALKLRAQQRPHFLVE